MLLLTTLESFNYLIGDLTGIEYAINLTHLDLHNNRISDISSLAGLTNLTHLDLGGNRISNISSSAGLTNLTYLTLGGNRISDISSLAGLTKLMYLPIQWLLYRERPWRFFAAQCRSRDSLLSCPLSSANSIRLTYSSAPFVPFAH
jgi:Leucine-rich repeat (LRR) protein